MDEHVLFDVIPDEIITPEQRAAYSWFYDIDSVDRIDGESFDDLTRFDAPATVRVSASRPARGDEVTLHFVNYNREEGSGVDGGGSITDEKPIAVTRVGVDFVVPSGSRAVRVETLSPETPEPQAVPIKVNGDRIRFTVPGFLVYGMARIHLGRSDSP